MFNDQVVVVTGGGKGLGLAYVEAFAKHGAKVVVNDVAEAGPGNLRPAEMVVKAIQAKGGKAVANFDSVLEGEKIIKQAIETYGRVDVLINNAGILRDASFAKMTQSQWDDVLNVHVKGAFCCAKAAWPHMQKQKFGRIINITSATGLYGNFGQANYGAAKMALVGLSKTLAQEGNKYDIHVNCVAPLAGTSMTENLLPEPLLRVLKPEHVAPVVLYLCSKNCKDTGKIYEVGAGWVAAVHIQRNSGTFLPVPFDVKEVENAWKKINDLVQGNMETPASLQDSIIAVSKVLSVQQNSSNSLESTSNTAASTLGSSSARIFNIIKAYLEHKPEIAASLKTKINSLFQFEVTDSSSKPPKVVKYVIDLTSKGGRAYEGSVESPDATFIIVDDVLNQIIQRKLNPQVAFLQGKMKIRGSMAKATKFTPDIFPQIPAEAIASDAGTTSFIESFKNKAQVSNNNNITKEQTPKEQESKAQNVENKNEDTLTPNAMKMKSAALYPLLRQHLLSPAGATLAKKINCIYRLNITSPGLEPCTFYINLKESPPTISERPFACKDKFDCCFSMADDVFLRIAMGKQNPQMAFMQGKMKIKGSTQAAMKFTRDLFPKVSRL